jgi:hypothetical protein
MEIGSTVIGMETILITDPMEIILMEELNFLGWR